MSSKTIKGQRFNAQGKDIGPVEINVNVMNKGEAYLHIAWPKREVRIAIHPSGVAVLRDYLNEHLPPKAKDE
jgi:hypothetical protein